MRIAILTISDAGARGERADTSGDAIEAWARGRGYDVAARDARPRRHRADRRARSSTWCDDDDADLVLTTGGTGLSARDVTPEATRAVLEREAPGIAERIRAHVDRVASRAPRCRAAWPASRKKTLIVNLPGSTERREATGSPRSSRSSITPSPSFAAVDSITARPPRPRAHESPPHAAGRRARRPPQRACSSGTASRPRSSRRSTTSAPRSSARSRTSSSSPASSPIRRPSRS